MLPQPEDNVPHGELLRRWQEEQHEWHRRGVVEVVSEFAAWLLPIPMVLQCPACGAQHIDKATEDWPNPPHRSHLCGECGCIWRPADVPTVGVEAIETKGKADNWATAGVLSGRVDIRDPLAHALTSPGPVNCLLRIRLAGGQPAYFGTQSSKCERCGGTTPKACLFFEVDGAAKQAESPCSESLPVEGC